MFDFYTNSHSTFLIPTDNGNIITLLLITYQNVHVLINNRGLKYRYYDCSDGAVAEGAVAAGALAVDTSRSDSVFSTIPTTGTITRYHPK